MKMAEWPSISAGMVCQRAKAIGEGCRDARGRGSGRMGVVIDEKMARLVASLDQLSDRRTQSMY